MSSQIGIMLIATGVLFLFSKHIPFIGHLPGDIYIQGKNFKLAFPFMSCLLLSIILSIAFKLLGIGNK
jgi:hypothetical protein